jgi:hypothetical protein
MPCDAARSKAFSLTGNFKGPQITARGRARLHRGRCAKGTRVRSGRLKGTLRRLFDADPAAGLEVEPGK